MKSFKGVKLKITFFCIMQVLFLSCAISPKSEEMKQYAFLSAKKTNAGTVDYMEITHFRFKTQPREFSDILSKEECGKKEVKYTSERREQRSFHGATNLWVIRDFECI
jgi:hypothetical protein